MQVIIPMSGKGERFIQDGYFLPKPLIEVDGKPMIYYIINMFSEKDEFIFICNEEHLKNKNFQMKNTLLKYAPNSTIISIKPHKLGPVYALRKAFDFIDDNKETIVNYCDFTCFWKYNHLKNFISRHQPDGMVISYKGFHPHVFWGDSYGYMKVKENLVLDYQEKKPFTENPHNEYTSTGTYFFKNGRELKKYSKACISNKLLVNNEYYVSMIYKSMLSDNRKVLNYEIQHFMQWGTPRDLKEYVYWSEIFQNINKNNSRIPGILMMPMVGEGKRFSEEGYILPKPLIEVSSQHMFRNALNFLPNAKANFFIVRNTMNFFEELKQSIINASSNSEIIVLENITNGQAITCFEGIKQTKENTPITISSCDNGVIYNTSKLINTMKNQDYDIIVWGARNYPLSARKPNMYGWIELENDTNYIKSISVKKPLGDTKEDPIVIGTFTFRRSEDYISSLNQMKSRKAKINGEYYIDMMINDAVTNGKKCVYFEVDKYISWGTPLELQTFNYWQECFHKWDLHEYDIYKDNTIPIKNKKGFINKIDLESKSHLEIKNPINH